MKARRGFALAAAVLSLLLIAALVASAFFAAMEETRIAAAAVAKEAALTAAESAIESTIAAWTFADESIKVGEVRKSTNSGFGTRVEVSVTRLDSTLYWIVADAGGVSSGTTAERRIGAVVRAQTGPDHSTIIDRIPERWWSELF
jgi:type II secretory pathway pseudopilin PulG